MTEAALDVRHVPFMGDTLIAARDENGVIWVGVRWMAQGIGLNETRVRREKR